jgi:SAM-dependent methyltransferase
MSIAEFEDDSYRGSCAICGCTQLFSRKKRAIRETYHCKDCKGSLRERAQAQAILECYRDPSVSTLVELSAKEWFSQLRIYEPGTTGTSRKFFKTLKNYYQSDFYDERDQLEANHEVPYQNIEDLTYQDQYFDLVLTSEILEHVRKPQKALHEIYRTLKPGGYHIFTVPLQEPLSLKNLVRVDTSNSIDIPILSEHYHGNGKGGKSLVYTDFGLELIDWLTNIGFIASLMKHDCASRLASKVYTVVAQKPINPANK